MDFKKFCYWPVLKTKDAELRGISNVSTETFSKLIPIYELTKSRISKNNPIGDISKRLEQIGKIQGDHPFVLDVSTDPAQQNPQIESLLSPSDGYLPWLETLLAYPNLNIIPTVHVNFDDDADLQNTQKFVENASAAFPHMALRLPASLEPNEYSEIINFISPKLNGSTLLILLDEGCIRANSKQKSLESIAELYAAAYDSLMSIPNSSTFIAAIISICGSFPQSPAQEGGNTEQGSFEILEHQLYRILRPSFTDLKFGDYASVNINQREMRGGTFIPRIDFCTEDRFYYYRYPRQAGSYIKCAQKVINDPNYYNQGTWGDEEITNASQKMPSGISPSFWISVRINNYITSRVATLDR